MGLDLSKHALRFVEDNWESPTLGAAGVGWEVWLDGMEITQFTFFQEIGGVFALYTEARTEIGREFQSCIPEEILILPALRVSQCAIR